MKKILISSVLLGSMLFATAVKIQIPMSSSALSTDNGGSKSAIEAYGDGVGIYVAETLSGKITNQEMNSLVYKYGEAAKDANMTVKDYVNDNGTGPEKALNVGKFEPMASNVPVDGTQCNDNNDQTINDIYVNGTCEGTVLSDIYVENGVIKCEDASIGDELMLGNVSYLVVGNSTIKNNIHRVATICTSKVTNMNNVFEKLPLFNEPLNHLDVSNVTSMNHTFFNTGAFNKPLSNWDTGKVTSMRYMFAEAKSFNQPLNNWDVSNVVNMNAMFYTAPLFNQPLNNWNTSKVNNLEATFYLASSFNQYIKNWDVSNIIYSATFRSGSALTAENSPL